MSVRLIKDGKVVKLPQASGTVRGILRRAEALAREQGWTQIVIIGEGPDKGCSFNSRMKRNVLLGMLEDAKHECLHD